MAPDLGHPDRQARHPRQENPTQNPPKTHPAEFYVYVTKTGKKYHHDPCCPAILDAFTRGDAIKMAVFKAEAAGRTPCNKCCDSDYD